MGFVRFVPLGNAHPPRLGVDLGGFVRRINYTGGLIGHDHVHLKFSVTLHYITIRALRNSWTV